MRQDVRTLEHARIAGQESRTFYPATQKTGVLLSTTLHDILEVLLAHTATGWTPWLGEEPLPRSGVIVTETNPTTSMAMALPMADPGTLPARKASRVLLDGTRVRAKSDWYWRAGARDIAAETLKTPAVREEDDHERVAALWCLALARELEGSGQVTVLGDGHGTYLVTTLDRSWIADAERVGVRWGQIHAVDRAPVSLPSKTAELSCLSGDELQPDTCDYHNETMRGDLVRVFFTDMGGLTRKANAWLSSVDFPCTIRLFGRTTVEVSVIPFAAPNHHNQFKVEPTIHQLMSAWGGPAVLRGDNEFEVRGEILSASASATLCPTIKRSRGQHECAVDQARAQSPFSRHQPLLEAEQSAENLPTSNRTRR